MKTNKKILILAGGTGGHIFPALAVADLLRAKGVDILWLGTKAGLESQLVPQAGFTIRFVWVKGIRGKSFKTLLLAPLYLLTSFFQSCWFILQFKPDTVFAVGGFVCGPAGIASWLLKRRLVIHEANAIAGTTNKILSHFADKVLEGFPGVFPKKTRAILTGNPVRKELINLVAPEKRFLRSQDKFHLLILGGSRGALAINTIIPTVLKSLNPDQRPLVWHQTGSNTFEQTKKLYAEAGVEAKITPFIDDMKAAYAFADLVVARAGAMSVSELSAAGCASLLIPYPFATDHHQSANAQYLACHDASIVVEQKALTVEKLKTLLLNFMKSPEKKIAMAKKARSLAMPNSAADIAEICLEGSQKTCVLSKKYI